MFFMSGVIAIAIVKVMELKNDIRNSLRGCSGAAEGISKIVVYMFQKFKGFESAELL